MGLKGVVFDLDGVITDTAEYHFQAWQALGKDIGIEFDRAFNEELKGVGRMESLEKILSFGKREGDFSFEEKLELAKKKNEHYLELINNIKKEDLLPGIKNLLEDLKNENILIALGSASKNGPQILKQLEIEDYFDFIANPENVKNSKPHPDIFIEACRGLGINTKEAIGIEDAISGIEALKSAGIFSIGIGVEGDLSLKSTEELNIDLIKNVVLG